jgi:hypothetical protein
LKYFDVTEKMYAEQQMLGKHGDNFDNWTQNSLRSFGGKGWRKINLLFNGAAGSPLQNRRSYKNKDVKEKNSPHPSGDAGVVTSSPTSFLTSFLEGLLVCSLWLAAHSRGNANPTCLSQLDGFMKSVALDAVRFRRYAS